MLSNMKFCIREEKDSFWFDRWMSTGLLCESVSMLVNPTLKVQDCFRDGNWDVELLHEVVGSSKALEIVSEIGGVCGGVEA